MDTDFFLFQIKKHLKFCFSSNFTNHLNVVIACEYHEKNSIMPSVDLIVEVYLMNPFERNLRKKYCDCNVSYLYAKNF